MRRWAYLTAAVLCLAPVLGPARADDRPAKKPADQKAEGGSCGDYGTSVVFEDSPKEAAAKAKKDQKLVFILHVSGHFEDPKLT